MSKEKKNALIETLIVVAVLFVLIFGVIAITKHFDTPKTEHLISVYSANGYIIKQYEGWVIKESDLKIEILDVHGLHHVIYGCTIVDEEVGG